MFEICILKHKIAEEIE